MTDIQARIDAFIGPNKGPTYLSLPEAISIIKELQAIMRPDTPELEETFLRNWLFGSIVIPDAVKARIIEKGTAELQAQLSGKAGQLESKDALIAELQKENEWLPIETMPESEPVLVVFGIRPDVKIGILSTDGDVWDESFACTLSDPKVWKKLPEPPKGI